MACKIISCFKYLLTNKKGLNASWRDAQRGEYDRVIWWCENKKAVASFNHCKKRNFMILLALLAFDTSSSETQVMSTRNDTKCPYTRNRMYGTGTNRRYLFSVRAYRHLKEGSQRAGPFLQNRSIHEVSLCLCLCLYACMTEMWFLQNVASVQLLYVTAFQQHFWNKR